MFVGEFRSLRRERREKRGKRGEEEKRERRHRHLPYQSAASTHCRFINYQNDLLSDRLIKKYTHTNVPKHSSQ